MRIGTRGSALALAQAHLVADLLGDGSELVTIAVSGDAPRRPDGDKSRWVAELDQALLAGEIDLAVHSAKDVPGTLADGLELLGTPARANAHDVLIGAVSLAVLPPGATVGTSSLRRRAQLLAAREELNVVELRGNVDTRLRKLSSPDLDAIVLAGAGLERLGRAEAIGATLDPALFVPAPGQGVLALEARAGDERARQAVEAITDPTTHACLKAERALARALSASCDTPLGAHARTRRRSLSLRAWVGLPDGSEWIADELEGPIDDPEGLGRSVAERMRLAGAEQLLARAEKMARPA